LHRPVLPALSQEGLLTGMLPLFSQTSHQYNVAFQPMKDYWSSSRKRKKKRLALDGKSRVAVCGLTLHLCNYCGVIESCIGGNGSVL
jgi:hypothetical protein